MGEFIGEGKFPSYPPLLWANVEERGFALQQSRSHGAGGDATDTPASKETHQ